MERIESHKLKNKERYKKKAKKITIPHEDDELEREMNKSSAETSAKSRLSTECELKLHESITESMIGSISEGLGSMVAQKIPSSSAQFHKIPLSKQQELNHAL